MIHTFNKLVNFDYSFSRNFNNYIFVGIDEVGRGSLAGPVIACAFSWKKEIRIIRKRSIKSLLRLNDSKKMTKNERKKISLPLKKYGNFAIGYASVKEIEKLNILNATFLAMKRAFENLLPGLNLQNSDLNTYVLIDGNKFNPYINSRQLAIIGGDAKSSLIASASVIAKVYRDTLMQRLSKVKQYRKFGWSKNAGYGTPYHRKAVKKYGLTPLHRKLFVRKIYSEEKIKDTVLLVQQD